MDGTATTPPPESGAQNGATRHSSHTLVASPALGEVVEAAHATAVLRLNAPASRTPLKVGEVLLVEGSSAVLVGEVTNLASSGESEGRTLFATLTLIATLDPKHGTLTPGMRDAVLLGGRGFRAHPAVIKAVIEDRTQVHHTAPDEILLTLAHAGHHPEVKLTFPPEKILGRHCAVVGTSGAGKSWSVARLIEQCSTHAAKLILIDPTGEYETLDEGVFHVHLGHSTRESTRSREASLPYEELTESDLVSIFRPHIGNQLTKLRAAIRTLKLLRVEPRLASDGTMIKAHKPKAPFEAACQLAKSELDRPENHFDITKLPLQIEYECVEPFRSQTEIDVWGGGSAHDQAQCASLINRINDVLHAQELRALFHPSKEPSILKVLDRFFSDDAVRTLRISLEFLPVLHRTREIITNAIARTLLGYARQSRFRARPLVVVLDEAHQALSSKLSDLSLDFPLEAFNIIAKEGRKYGLTLCLATQRPRDIPEDVLSQVGTFIVHRLVNDGDRGAVERATGSAHAELISLLPTLAPGEAFIIGVDFPTPLRVRMLPPNAPPNSRGPDYQKLWRKPAS